MCLLEGAAGVQPSMSIGRTGSGSMLGAAALDNPNRRSTYRCVTLQKRLPGFHEQLGPWLAS